MATTKDEIEKLLSYARNLLTSPGRVVTLRSWRDPIALPDGPNGEKRYRKGKLSVLFEAVNESAMVPASPIVEHRDFVYDGEVFQVTKDEDGDVSGGFDAGHIWASSPAITAAAALHTLWSVAEDRDKLRAELAATRPGVHALLDLSEERDKLRADVALLTGANAHHLDACRKLARERDALQEILNKNRANHERLDAEMEVLAGKQIALQVENERLKEAKETAERFARQASAQVANVTARAEHRDRRAEELYSTVDSLYERLKRRKAKIRKLRKERDELLYRLWVLSSGKVTALREQMKLRTPNELRAEQGLPPIKEEEEPSEWQKRIDLQLDVADILHRRYGTQATGGNLEDDGGLDLSLGWKEAERFLADLRSLLPAGGTKC